MVCSPVSDTGRSNTYLKNLQRLYLTHNNLARIEQTDLSCLSNVVELDLAHNKIEYIALNSFKNLNRLKLLKIAYNPNLVPQPASFVGLQGSLSHLAINFNTDSTAKTMLGFDLVLESLIDNYKLTNLEYLDLDGSYFESIRINLGYLFFQKNNRLKVVRCANCDVKSLYLDYDLNRKFSGYNSQEVPAVTSAELSTFESFNENFKASICPREVMPSNIDHNKYITLDFNDYSVKHKKTSAGMCKSGNGTTRDEVSLTCNKKNYFINKLLKYLQINNLICTERLPDGKNKHVEVYKYKVEKYSSLSKYFESTSCNERMPSAVDCSRYFQVRKTVADDQLVAKSDWNKNAKAESSTRKASFSIILTLSLLVYVFF